MRRRVEGGRAAWIGLACALAALACGGCAEDGTRPPGAPDGAGPSLDAGVLDASTLDASTLDADAPVARPSLVVGGHDVLYVGNSYVFTNDVPARHRALAAALPAMPVRVEAVAFGGYRLAQHAADARTDGTPLSRWLREGTAAERAFDVVVLQEQSQIGGFPEGQPERVASVAAALELGALAAADGASVVLYATWGRARGDATNPGLYPDFTAMQDRLDAAYRAMAARLVEAGVDARIAPVGAAFRAVHAAASVAGADPLGEGSEFLALYEPDGSHPSPRGAFLAACVLVGTITGADPAAFPDDPALDAAVSARLRDVASAVLADPAWAGP